MHVLSRELIQEVDRYVDERHGRFAGLGAQFFEQFRSDGGKVSTQVRNLQQIACSATRFADIEDFVKNQMGKDIGKWRAVGNDVLAALSQLRNDSEEIAGDGADRMAVRLRLARGWVRAVVGEYMYQLARDRMEAQNRPPKAERHQRSRQPSARRREM